jgi:thioesterase domain-containing protein
LSREQIPASIEEMAAERLPRLLAVQSKGPFLLGGACVGGHIALETARLLIQAGHEVESVIMIDSPLLNARPSMRSFYDFASIVCGKSNLDLKPRFQQLLDKAWLLGSKAETLIRTPAGTRWTRVSSSIKRQLSSIRTSEGNEQELSRSTPSIEHLQLSERTEAAYLRNLRRYFPKPLEVRIVFFSAEYLAGPLRHLTSNVKLLNIPGGHWSWTNTYLDVLANLLRAEIAVDQRKEALLR